MQYRNKENKFGYTLFSETMKMEQNNKNELNFYI